MSGRERLRLPRCARNDTLGQAEELREDHKTHIVCVLTGGGGLKHNLARERGITQNRGGW